ILIDQAKEYLGVDSKNVERMIRALEGSKLEAEKEYDNAIRLVQESELIKEKLTDEWKEFTQVKDALYERAEEKAEEALEKARKDAEAIVAEVRDMKDQTMWKEHEWIEARKQLDDAQPQLRTEEKEKAIQTEQLS